ncbi:hypothetical protein [Bacillus cereus]|uniref:hypothetical protein n=1 Tax=Bacillus cereus TaxID=1396 RepID=UPI000BF6F3A7|nr:hypothetical protein [Bacillus cereus]PFJ30594.1 hypothetical protein COI92_06275 [Bacillus anthracis]PGW00664.1 hypothetical protein COD87_30800 [Bacillus cereus]
MKNMNLLSIYRDNSGIYLYLGEEVTTKQQFQWAEPSAYIPLNRTFDIGILDEILEENKITTTFNEIVTNPEIIQTIKEEFM